MAIQDLVAQLGADDVRQLWVIYHDYSGLSHAKTVPPERFEGVLRSGASFAKANMDFNVQDQQVAEPVFTAETGDFLAVPDPATYALVPYHSGVARTYTFLHLGDGSRWDGCPRTVLERVLDRYEAAGLRVRSAFEPECYLFRNIDGTYVPADQTRMFTVTGIEEHYDLIRELMETLPAMGVVLEQAGAEYGPAQYEINLRHAPAMQAADDLNTLKETFRALAARHGLIVSFMPKPYAELPGCGLHVHVGIETPDGRNALEGTSVLGLSDMGRAFVAGLLAHAPALSGIGAPTVNSYKRLLPGSWSPAHIAYGASNRAALVRIPDAGVRHVEYRSGDNTSNPHLFLAAILAAGLDGIERNLDPGDPVEDDIGHVSAAEVAARGLSFLPRSAAEALEAVERDEVVMNTLGPTIGPTFLRVKRSEVATYDTQVSDWERSAYLTTI